MKSLSKTTADILVSQAAISKEDAEICSYGLEIFFASAIELIAIFIISAFAGNFLPTLLFFSFFIPLRIYAGGYHADTKLKCFFVSLLVYFVFSVILAYLPHNLYVYMIVAELAFTLTMVVAKAPVVHYNKSINSKEKGVYRKISLAIAFSESAIIVAFTMLDNKAYALAMSLGQLGESLSMLAALIKTKITGK